MIKYKNTPSQNNFFTNPEMGFSQQTITPQKYNLSRNLPTLFQTKKSSNSSVVQRLTNNMSLDQSIELQYFKTEAGPNCESSPGYDILQDLVTTQPFNNISHSPLKYRSLLKRVVDFDYKKPSHKQPKEKQSIKVRYTIEDHLNNLNRNSNNLGKLSNKMKNLHSEEFKQNAQDTFDQASTEKMMSLFKLMQKNILMYPKQSEPRDKLLLQHLEQFQQIQLDTDLKINKKRAKKIAEDSSYYAASSGSPIQLKGSDYKNQLKKRLTKQISIANFEIFDQLKLSHILKDPLESKKIQYIMYFFNDLLNNVIDIQNFHRRGTQQLIQMNGCNNQIHDLLFINKDNIRTLRTNSSQLLYQSYLKVDQIDQSQQIKEIVSQIEKSELFKKLNYFNNSLMLSIQKRIDNQFNIKIALKTKLQNRIQTNLNKYNNYFDQSIIQQCKPQILRIPQRSILDKVVNFSQQGASPLIHLNSLDRFRWQSLDKTISKTYDLRQDIIQ